MTRRLSVLALGLVLVGCSSRVAGDAVGPAGPDVAALRVTGTEAVAVAGPVRLSPDGGRLLRLLPAEPCVVALDGSDEHCLGRDEVKADLNNAQWSPDGTKLTFTDDYWRRLLEPDVWVLDVTSGELRNLTDDGVDELDVGAPDEDADIDLLPSWSPDGKTVRFARGHGKSDSVSLVSVPAGGGEVSTVREARCGPNALTALTWSATHVAWTCGIDKGEVTLAELSGDGETTLPSKKDEDRMLLSFSPDGRWLLVDSVRGYSDYAATGGLATAVPTGGGDPVPVAGGNVAFPTWAPDGHVLAYIDIGRPRGPDTLNVVAEPGGTPKELHSAEALSTASAHRLDWSEDKLLLFVEEAPALLSLAD